MTKQHVLLVNPFYEHFPGKRKLPGYSEPPVGLAYLASAATQAAPGLRADIVDPCIENIKDDVLVERIRQERPRILGFYSSTITIPSIGRMAAAIKRASPDTIIVLGGPHISAMPEDLPDSVDLGVIGEGEATFGEIVARAVDGRGLSGIQGTVWRKEGTLAVEERRPPIEPIDGIDFPAHRLLTDKPYFYQYPVRSRSRRYLGVVASRGCPFDCTFCTKTAVWGWGVRRRSVRNVLQELKEIQGLGIDLISFRDDTFTAQKAFVMELCEGMIRENLDMRWACYGRGDQIDEEMAAVLSRAGCFEMHIGIETASEEILRETNKRLNKEKLEKGFALLKKRKIRAKGTFILGLPGEDEEQIRTTVAYALTLDPTFCFFSSFVPYPGTVHFPEYLAKGYLLTGDYKKFNYHGDPIIQTPLLSARRLKYLRKWAYRKFFLRPGKILQIGADLMREGGVPSLLRALRSFANVAS